MAKDTLLSLLAHQTTRDLMGRLARGDDPRLAVAEMAGVSLAEGIAKALGAAMPAQAGRQAVRQPIRPAAAADSEITDAEFTVINVTEKAKKGKK